MMCDVVWVLVCVCVLCVFGTRAGGRLWFVVVCAFGGVPFVMLVDGLWAAVASTDDGHRRTTGDDDNATIGVVDCAGDGRRTVQYVRGGLCHSMCRVGPMVATVLSALQYMVTG